LTYNFIFIGAALNCEGSFYRTYRQMGSDESLSGWTKIVSYLMIIGPKGSMNAGDDSFGH